MEICSWAVQYVCDLQVHMTHQNLMCDLRTARCPRSSLDPNFWSNQSCRFWLASTGRNLPRNHSRRYLELNIIRKKQRKAGCMYECTFTQLTLICVVYAVSVLCSLGLKEILVSHYNAVPFRILKFYYIM